MNLSGKITAKAMRGIRRFTAPGAKSPPWESLETSNGTLWHRHFPEDRFSTTPATALWAQSAAELLSIGVSLADDGRSFHQWVYKDPQKDGAFHMRDTDRERLAGVLARPPKVITPAGLPDALCAKLLPYQRPAAALISSALQRGMDEWGYPGALDASDMGTGKTYQTLAAAISLHQPIGIVCPKVAQIGWREAFAHFGVEPAFLENYEALRNGKKKGVAGETPSGLRWKNAGNLTLIFDEAHRMRYGDTLNTALGMSAVRQNIPIIAASATIATSPAEMMFSGIITGLHDGTQRGFERFLAEHHCVPVAEGKWALRSQSGLVRISQTLFPNRGVRVRIADLGDMFPKTEISLFPINAPGSAKLESQFNEVLKFTRRLEKQHGNAPWIKAKFQTAYNNAWHEAHNLMIPGICRLAREEMAAGRSVAIFCSFTDTRLAIQKELNTSLSIHGQQTEAQRLHARNQFQSDRERVIVCNVSAGGVAISLHDVRGEFPRTAIILPATKVIDMVQATGRIHRATAKSPSVQYIPFCPGGVMEGLVRKIRMSMSAIAKINDGADGSPAL